MNSILSGSGEIALENNDSRIVAYDSLEQWQVDQLLHPVAEGSDLPSSNACLRNLDKIVSDWVAALTIDEWNKINRQKSLFGIKLPEKWVKVWRHILKESDLRNSEKATRNGRNIGSYQHLWNLWAEETIERYLDDISLELLELVDAGLLYSEIGDILLGKYGDEFWRPRKENTTTTPSQVVNNYLHQKMPNRIARGELTSLVLGKLRRVSRFEKLTLAKLGRVD